jgi:hypothetical protein
MTTTTASKPLRVPTLASSDLRQVHSLGGPLGAALAADDRWRAAVEALHALQAAGRALADAGDPVAHLADELTAAAGNGEPIDVLERAAAHSARADSVRVARLALQRAQVHLETELDQAARDAYPALYRALADQFDEVAEQLTATPAPRQLTSAETAIDAGRVSDWQAWRELLDRHAQIRQQQGKLMRLTGVTTPYTEAAFIRQPERLWPEWVTFYRDGGRVADLDSPRRGEPIVPPWPTDGDGRVPAAGAGSEAFVMWALEADAELWLPTPDELAKESRRLAALVTPAN